MAPKPMNDISTGATIEIIVTIVIRRSERYTAASLRRAWTDGYIIQDIDIAVLSIDSVCKNEHVANDHSSVAQPGFLSRSVQSEPNTGMRWRLSPLDATADKKHVLGTLLGIRPTVGPHEVPYSLAFTATEAQFARAFKALSKHRINVVSGACWFPRPVDQVGYLSRGPRKGLRQDRARQVRATALPSRPLPPARRSPPSSRQL